MFSLERTLYKTALPLSGRARFNDHHDEVRLLLGCLLNFCDNY